MTRDPVILLVEHDPQEAQRLTEAVMRLALPRPVHVANGEGAVLWMGAHECDACLLDYHLPGIDGLETLVRMRQRNPAVSVVMLSAAQSERVAVAAFRAGAADYVAKEAGYHDAAAHLVRRLTADLQPVDDTPAPTLVSVTGRLVRLTYENRLRAIGRQLDLYRYRSVNVLEVNGGFVVRAMVPGSYTPEALEFTNRDFPQLVTSATAARGLGVPRRAKLPLLPTGYEDFLRAWGHRFDEQRASAIAVNELASFIAVAGIVVPRRLAPEAAPAEPFQEVMSVEEIQRLLQDAQRRRGSQRLTFTRLPRRADE